MKGKKGSGKKDAESPLPHERETAVKELEKFNRPLNNISEELTAGMKESRKQYEYYRNKFLT